MAEERVQRRLAAILAADVVGYSRLMGEYEEATLAALTAHLADLIEPCIAEHRGRVVKTTGDGLLAEFASVVDAVRCAVAVQDGMRGRNADVAAARRIEFRVGVNLGDVIVQDDDVYGDGVNVAARLEGLAEPGGVCVSDLVHQSVAGKVDLAFDDLGEREVKNIARPVRCFAVRFGADGATASGSRIAWGEQDIRFCTAPDGVRLAYSRIGDGTPIVKTGNWMTHLEYDLESPIWRHLYEALSQDHTLVRYDARGNGLSDWEVEDISFEAFVSDLEVVVEAAGIERFALFGISQGCAISIAYAVRHPERLTHLVLYGGFALGRNKRATSEAEREQEAAMATLMRLGWGQDDASFRQLFTSQFIPGGTKQQMDWFNELQRISTSPDNAARNLEAAAEVDVTELLAQVAVPTLVMHARDEVRVPFDAGRQMAAGIPGARFVPLQSRNHLILGDEPAFGRFVEELTGFVRE